MPQKPGHPSLKLLFILLLCPLFFHGQSLTGLWTGALSNDSNTIRKDQLFEIALTEYRGKVYGYSRSEFIVNDTLYYILKRVKGTINGDICEVTDDEIISFNFPGKLDKGVKVTSTFKRNKADSTWYLAGTWKTNATKRFYSITGKVDLQEDKDLGNSKIFPHLEELNLADQVAFYKERKEGAPIVVKKVKPEVIQTEYRNKTAIEAPGMEIVKVDPGSVVTRVTPVEEKIAAARKEEEKKQEQARLEEEKRKAQLEEEKKKLAALEEEKKKAAEAEEQKRLIAKQEEERKAAEIEAEKTRLAQMEAEEKKAAEMEEQKKKLAQLEEEKKKAAAEEEKRKLAQVEEEKKKAARIEEERQRLVKLEEARKKAAAEEEKRRIAAEQERQRLVEQERQRLADAEKQRLANQQKEKPAASPDLTGKTVISSKAGLEELIRQTRIIGGRTSEFSQEVTFKSDSLELSLYDNGEIDGDTVSVYINGELVMAKQGLKAAAIKKTIYFKPEDPGDFTLVLFAENLGKYPPNTGLLVVHDGDDIYHLRFSSDLQKSSGIVFKRRK